MMALNNTLIVAGVVCFASLGLLAIQIDVAKSIHNTVGNDHATFQIPCHQLEETPTVDEAPDGRSDATEEIMIERGKLDPEARSTVSSTISKLAFSVKSNVADKDVDEIAKRSIQPRNATPAELKNQNRLKLAPNRPYPKIRERLKVVPIYPHPIDVDLINACNMTGQVQLDVYENETWILRTFDSRGNPKQVGGDEFFVEYSDANNRWNDRWQRHRKNEKRLVTAAAMAHDMNDGSYRLEFGQLSFEQETLLPRLVPSPAGNGFLYVNLQYSCGLGTLRPTRKQYWSQGGASAVRLTMKVPMAPRMKVAKPQSITTDGSGDIDLSGYDMVYMVGDSTMEQFVGSYKVGSYNHGTPGDRKAQNLMLVGDKEHFFRPNTYILKNVYSCLSDEKSLLKFKNLTDYGLNHLPWVKNARKRALVVGAFMWELLGYNDFDQQNDNEFRLPIAYLRMLMEYIKETYGDTVDIFFKSGTAVQVHEVSTSRLVWRDRYRVFYMSNSRADKLHRLEMELMRDLGIPVLDIYRASFFGGHHLIQGDGRHFKSEFNRWLLSHYYSDTAAQS